jgi:hypothetical protein
MTLTPAYGRDYKTQASVLADFNANKDFILRHLLERDRPINKEQIPPGTRIQLRYSKLTKVVGYTV